MKKKWKRVIILIILGVIVILITTVGTAFSGKIIEEINKKGWFGNKNQLQAIVEPENSGTEIAEQNSEENSGIAVQDSSVSTQVVDTSNWDLTKVDIVYDTANVAVPVPKGYVASGADGEHTVNTGFVIYEGDIAVTTANAWSESCTRNQWVWVPVHDVSRIYEVDANGKKKSKLYTYSSTGRTIATNDDYEPGILSTGIVPGLENEEAFAGNQLQGMTREKLLHELQEEFDFTIESIKRYGGFYIGRYETGNLSSKIPVVQRMNTDISNQTWYTEYSRLQRLGANNNVKSNMILGGLWHETLQWLVDSGNKTYAELANSTGWGNYLESNFKYKKDINGSLAAKLVDRAKKIPAGSTEYSKANNIYDMAGNVWDDTLECNFVYRTGYGAAFERNSDDEEEISDTSVHYTLGDIPDMSDITIGYRAYLYIK